MKTYLTKKIVTTTAIVSLAFFVNIGTNAEIYKWTDAKGIVHYTANKPTQKKIKAEDIEVQIRSAAGKYKATNTTSHSPQNTSTRNSDEQQREDVKLKGPDPKLVSYCKQQRNNLSSLQKNYRNVWQGADGKKKKLNQEERQLKVNELQDRISEDCAGL